MKGSDGKRKELTKREVSAINRDVVVFAFFLVLSFGLWYINSLGKETEADIKYPVKYINIPKAREISEETAAKLSLSLKGPGYTVLKLKVSGKKPPVLIDLSKVSYRRVPESKASDYFIVTSVLVKSLTVQIRSGCEIISIKPDTLFFSLNKENPKSVEGSR
ncbi:MAG: hypothetical protein IPN67_12310 [Bacteroidales bacterium]|nr:hypothetical protein [Bacteroidales bacterium]